MRATMLVSDAVPPSGSDGLFAGVFARGGAREEVGDRAWLQGDARLRGGARPRLGPRRRAAPARRGRRHRRGMPARSATTPRELGRRAAARRQPGRPAGARAHRAGARGRRRLGAPRRDEPGRPRHRRDARRPARARADRRRPGRRGGGRGARWRRRHRGTVARRAHAAAAGAADDVRPEGRRLARRARRGARAAWPTCASACPPSSSAARWARSPRSATHGPAVAAGMAERARAGRARAALAHDRTRPGRRSPCALGVAAGVLAKVARDIVAARPDRGRRGRRGAAPGRAAPRRCRTSATRWRPSRRSPAPSGCPGSSPPCSRRWRRSTSAPPAPGTPSGRRCRDAAAARRLGGGLAARRARGAARSTPARMRANLDRTGGLLMAESVTTRLVPALGRLRRARAGGGGVPAGGGGGAAAARRPARATSAVREHLDARRRSTRRWSPPATSARADALIDRALAAHRDAAQRHDGRATAPRRGRRAGRRAGARARPTRSAARRRCGTPQVPAARRATSAWSATTCAATARSPVPPRPYAIDDLGADVARPARPARRSSARPTAALSLGGMVGMWLGAHAPERVDRLVALLHVGAARPARALVGRARRRSARRARARSPRPSWRAGSRPASRRREPAFVAAMRAMLAATAGRGLRRLLRGDRAHGPARRAAGAIARADARRSPAATTRPRRRAPARRSPSGIPGARLVVLPDAAHLANVEQPATVDAGCCSSHLGGRGRPGRYDAGHGGAPRGAGRRPRRPRDRAHDAVHRGLPGLHHPLRVGRACGRGRAWTGARAAASRWPC